MRICKCLLIRVLRSARVTFCPGNKWMLWVMWNYVLNVSVCPSRTLWPHSIVLWLFLNCMVTIDCQYDWTWTVWPQSIICITSRTVWQQSIVLWLFLNCMATVDCLYDYTRLFPTDVLVLEPVGFGGVLLSTPLHVFFFFFLDLHHLLNVHVQLANKIGFNKKKIYMVTIDYMYH
jgi:hypothetical protein